MIKVVTLAGALALAMTTASLAQTTGPSGQQDTNKSGMANPDAAAAQQGSPGGARTTEPKMGTTGSGGMTKNSSGGMATPGGSTTGPSGQTSK